MATMCAPDEDERRNDVQRPVSPLVERVLFDLAEVVEAMGRLDRDLVALARDEGVTWSTIGEAFGISRQAATNYYTAEPPDDPQTRQRRPRRQKAPPAQPD